MPIVRQVDLARTVAARLVGRLYADDIAHDVAVTLIAWPWHPWRDADVVEMAETYARAELEHQARHVTLPGFSRPR